MHFYLGLTILSMVVTFGLMIPYIGWLFKVKFTRRGEETEKRQGASQAFYKIRAMQSAKPPIATGAGILMGVVVLVLSFWFFGAEGPPRVKASYLISREISVIIFTFAGYGILGFYDDIIKIFGYEKAKFFGLRMRHKFALQWLLGLISAGMLYWGLGIDFINIPYYGLVHLGIGYFFLAAFLLVGFANAFDITDGLDGLSCGLLMISLLAFLMISISELDHVLAVFLSLWLGAVIAFLYFNVYPARIMLGNAGGLAFGATLALVGLLSGKMVAMLVVAGIYWVEGASSMIQLLGKRLLKRRIFPIAPLHHWLQLRGWEEPKLVARAWMAGLVLAIFGVWLAMM